MATTSSRTLAIFFGVTVVMMIFILTAIHLHQKKVEQQNKENAQSMPRPASQRVVRQPSLSSLNPGAGLQLSQHATFTLEYLPEVAEQHAGAWKFYPDGNTNYVYRVTLTTTATTTVKAAMLSTGYYGLAGYTGSGDVDDKQLYPIVFLAASGAQINTAYDQTLGIYPPGTYTLRAFGASAPGDPIYDAFTMTLYFTDGTYALAATPGTALYR